MAPQWTQQKDFSSVHGLHVNSMASRKLGFAIACFELSACAAHVSSWTTWDTSHVRQNRPCSTIAKSHSWIPAILRPVSLFVRRSAYSDTLKSSDASHGSSLKRISHAPFACKSESRACLPWSYQQFVTTPRSYMYQKDKVEEVEHCWLWPKMVPFNCVTRTTGCNFWDLVMNDHLLVDEQATSTSRIIGTQHGILVRA